ncbi:hypothetical protein CBR_g49274 [Chara braunii]|uniref:Reverse transcriptase domain-containing protein n=1 Tax=Chara braunii TaxID=69332 RepID=A0A388M4S7_CHABU|nr:hypothetical protein CBR_g49274 [Chara braunii]|eukprot:GBG89483.1 hypothetical protein CBR_g49274 [Chara braunii]
MWQWVRCPMGICKAPAPFQRAMNVTFHNFVNKTRLTQGMINFCIIMYMDDILVYSETYHEHAQYIEWTLGALRDAEFKMTLEKSKFFLSEILFLGYVVTRGGLRPDSKKVAVVKDAPDPTSVTQIIQELTIPLAQLVDDLPLDIISQSDESPVPDVFSQALTPYLQWSACLEKLEGNNNPPSQQPYLDPRGIIDLAFFQPRTASEDEEIALEEEEEEGEEEGEEEEETPEEGSYSEHTEGEQSDDDEEEEGDEEDDEAEEEESEWETLGEEADRMEGMEEDPETVSGGHK